MVKSHDTDRRDSDAPFGKQQFKEEYMFNTEFREGSVLEGGASIYTHDGGPRPSLPTVTWAGGRFYPDALM